MKTRVLIVCAVIFLFCGIVNAGINDGLVAYYPFNGNANDESGNGNNGTVNGATLTNDRFGNANSAYYFDGINNTISIKNNQTLNPSSAMSVAAWIKPANITTNRYYEILRNDGGYLLSFQENGTQLTFGLRTISGNNIETDTPISAADYTDGQWHSIVGLYDGSNITIFKDGILIGSKSQTGYIQVLGGGKLSIGSWSDRYEFFNGHIDDVRIYNRALSASEIQQLYRGGTCSSEVVKFTAGTPAKAADVNANFDALNCQIQAMKAIICQDHPTASICQ
jgi:hypothetical protein